MREVQHAHHAEDQRQAARQHEQQQAGDQSVEQREDDELDHGEGLTPVLSLGLEALTEPSRRELGGHGGLRSAPSAARRSGATGRVGAPRLGFGRSIWQVVGLSMPAAVTVDSVTRPKPELSPSMTMSSIGVHRDVDVLDHLVVLGRMYRVPPRIVALHAFQRQADGDRIGAAGSVDRQRQHLEHVQDAGLIDVVVGVLRLEGRGRVAEAFGRRIEPAFVDQSDDALARLAQRRGDAVRRQRSRCRSAPIARSR